MKLSAEFKAHLARIMEAFTHAKIENLAMSLGFDPADEYYSALSADAILSKLKKAEMLLELLECPGRNTAQGIKTIFEQLEKIISSEDFSTKIKKLNSTMGKTMQRQIDKEGNIIPVFDYDLKIIEKETYIERKLKEFGFNKTLTNYRDALNTYKTSFKGSISLLRSTFESLADEIIRSKGKTSKNSQKDKLIQLKELGILKEIDAQECLKCHYKKRDGEFNYSYDIYSLLSHYGSHKELMTEELANFLFTSTLTFFWFLINRYENNR